ncbi:MAG: hypothetical protein U5L07_09125 [Desulfobacterales bacterium]|nr:hypothetical protein [Desulfobacterales bacterium]
MSLFFCLVIATGSSDALALCFSQSHPGGSAIHYAIHGDLSAGQQNFGRTCDADQYSGKKRCVDISLAKAAQNIPTPTSFQSLAIIASGVLLDSDDMAMFFNRHPSVESSFPAPAPPIFLQTQTFLN